MRLLTWSDQGVSGPAPSHHGARPAGDLGPIRRLLAQPGHQYRQICLLSTKAGLARTRTLAKTLEAEVEVVELPVEDPSDYAQLHRALRGRLPSLAGVGPLDVLLSAGTPQAQTLWVILVQAGLLQARMLQVIPPAFVPRPHRSPVRVVSLDLEGFPEIRALRAEVGRLRQEADLAERHLLGDSEVLRTLRRRIARVGPSPLPVLVLGETGTGKELVARAVHAASERGGPFIAESCGALADSVLESELFGHEAGAFTGAVTRRRGLFELAQGGTLFLDEIGELSSRMQVALLRVLEEGVLRRVGGEVPVPVVVRVIAATHRDLEALVEAGRFRADLYYRLHGASLVVPPLRERLEDLPLLVRHFLGRNARRLEPNQEAWRLLLRYPWPGNVRELRAEVARWSVFAQDVVGPDDLAPAIRAAKAPKPKSVAPVGPLVAEVAALEAQLVARALAQAGGNLSLTARTLEIDRNTLKRKLRAYGLGGPNRHRRTAR